MPHLDPFILIYGTSKKDDSISEVPMWKVQLFYEVTCFRVSASEIQFMLLRLIPNDCLICGQPSKKIIIPAVDDSFDVCIASCM